MSATELSRFDELVSRYLDDELAPAHAGELLALLSEPSMAARFLEMVRLNSEIGGLLAAPVPDAAMVELVRTDLNKSLAGELRLGALAETREPVSIAGSLRTPPVVSTEEAYTPSFSVGGCVLGIWWTRGVFPGRPNTGLPMRPPLFLFKGKCV